MNAVFSGLVILLTIVASSKATFEQEIPNSEEYGVGCKSDMFENEDPSQIPPGSLDIDGNVFDSSRVIQVLRVTNGARWGTWGEPSFCPPDSYAAGYDMKIEPKQDHGDDTSLNAIKIMCKNRNGHFMGSSASKVGPYGSWVGSVFCPEDCEFLTSYCLQVEPCQSKTGDDTAANYVKFKCRCLDEKNKYQQVLAKYPGHGLFGKWGDWSDSCPRGSAICGIKTKVEDKQYFLDDTALNDAMFYCCK